MSTSATDRVPESGRAVAKAAASAFGTTGRVDRYHDPSESNWVDILACTDRPSIGFATFSTVSLHRFANLLEDVDIRVELAGVAAVTKLEYPNMLASAAFAVAKDGWLAAPGTVFQDLVSDYQLSAELRHLLWVPPFPWEQLGSLRLEDGSTVQWLLAVPITEPERRLLLEVGYDMFERRLADLEVEYFDLDRPSIV
jgi:hypothetical protein